MQVARSLRRLTAVADALADGDVGSHHAGLFASYHRDPRLADALERDQVVLVEEAVKLSWPHFVRVIAYWAQLQDPDGTDEDAEDRRANRKVHLSQTYEGSWVLDGVLDPVSGAVLAEALRRIERELFEADRAEAEKDGDPNPDVTRFARTPRQRRADALVELARRAMASPRGARLPAPLVTVLVGYETFAGRICELADGTVLAPSDVTALLDEAVIERVVFDGPSRVIDIGERRFFRAATRRAIEVRDRTCTHPYCDAPAHHCDVDHRRPASDGGSTTQDNGRLACPFHNHQRQRRGPPDW